MSKAPWKIYKCQLATCGCKQQWWLAHRSPVSGITISVESAPTFEKIVKALEDITRYGRRPR